MRTTIDIERDLLIKLRREAERQGVPLKHLLNATLRRGLEEAAPRRRRTRYRCPTFSLGLPRVALDKALALAAELEDQEVAFELDRHK